MLPVSIPDDDTPLQPLETHGRNVSTSVPVQVVDVFDAIHVEARKGYDTKRNDDAQRGR